MATVIRNPYGEAIKEATMFLLQQRLRNKELEQQESQFARNLDIDQQRIDAQNRATDFALFQSMTALEGPDKPLSQASDATKALFSDLFGTDPTQLPDIVLNPRNEEDRLSKMILDEFETLPPEARTPLLQRAISRKFTGEAKTPDQFAMDDDLTSLRRDAFSVFVEKSKSDPRLLTQLAKTQMGMPAEVSFMIGDQEVNFESPEAGRLAVQIMELMQRGELSKMEMSARSSQSNADMLRLMNDMSKTLQDQYKSAFNRELGTGVARTVANAAMSGTLEEVLSKNPENEDLHKAAELFMGAANVAQSGMIATLRAMPGGEEVANFMELSKEVAEFMPAEQRSKFLESLTRQMRQTGFPISGLDVGWFGKATITNKPTRKRDMVESDPKRDALRKNEATREIPELLGIDLTASAPGDLNSMTTVQLAEMAFSQRKIGLEQLKKLVGAREAARINNQKKASK